MSEQAATNFEGSCSVVKSAYGERFNAFIEVYRPFKAKYLKTYPTERGAKTGSTRALNQAAKATSEKYAKMILNAWREERNY